MAFWQENVHLRAGKPVRLEDYAQQGGLTVLRKGAHAGCPHSSRLRLESAELWGPCHARYHVKTPRPGSNSLRSKHWLFRHFSTSWDSINGPTSLSKHTDYSSALSVSLKMAKGILCMPAQRCPIYCRCSHQQNWPSWEPARTKVLEEGAHCLCKQNASEHKPWVTCGPTKSQE